MSKTYKIAVILLFLSLFYIIGSTFMLAKAFSAGYWEWGIYGSCFTLFICSLFIIFFRQESSESLKLKFRERKIEENEAEIQQLQNNYVEQMSLLADKETAVKQKLMQYKQYANFPDDAIAETKHKSYFDDEVAELLHNKAEIIFDKLINNKYIEIKNFKHELLLTDIVDLIESVARIHHPDSENPLLETSIENLLNAFNRLSLQLLVLIDSFPINIKEYNLRKTYLYLQKSATTVGYYKKAEPFLTFAAPILRIGLATNPMVGIAQTVALEAGKQTIKVSSEKYALNLLHDVIEIIGGQAETIFGDNTLRYRSKHWIYAVELTELIHHFSPVESTTLSKVMQIISGLLIRGEYERIYLFHCLSQYKSAKPELFSTDFFTLEDKQTLVKNLTDLIEETINKEKPEKNKKKTILWRKKAEQRLGIDIPLNIDRNDVEYLKNLLSSASPEKKLKPFLAKAILAIMEDGEIPQFIYTDIQIDSLFTAESIKQHWLVATNKQLRLLSINTDNKIQSVWYCDRTKQQLLSFQRVNKIVADDCKVMGGLWQDGFETDSTATFTIEGRKVGNYDSYFRILFDFKNILSPLNHT